LAPAIVFRLEGTPRIFYEKLGFFYTGEMEEDERVMRRDLE
jgi:hypothetical protein